MSARHVTMLAALSAIWGGSYLLIKYALDGFSAAAIVSYLAPGVALFYGAIFLDEKVTAAAIAGLALILAGVAIASRPKRVRVPVAAAAPARA